MLEVSPHSEVQRGAVSAAAEREVYLQRMGREGMQVKAPSAVRRIAPLRAVVRTERSTTEVTLTPQLTVTAPVLIHHLECGHTAEPLIRLGCRLPYPPKRRRCKKCLEQESGSSQ